MELKPCPFCGGETRYEYVKENGEIYKELGCYDSDCAGHSAFLIHYKEIGTMREHQYIEAWNKRASDE